MIDPADTDFCDAIVRRRSQIRAAQEQVDALRDADDSGACRTDAHDRPAPDRYPGYRILREIRRGGQGVVYHAVHRSTKREVAIKVLRSGALAQPQERLRFEREMRILGQLNHPNLVTSSERGSVDGDAYFVMDFIDGRPLDQWCDALGATPLRQRGVDGEIDADDLKPVLRVFGRLAEAVHAAHLAGVIHRDLKPSNVLIDANDQPHVLDFGLARTDRSVADEASGATEENESSGSITVSGQFVGSLAWAAPEQIDGERVDIRCDVYALGVILYQLLTGCLPDRHELVDSENANIDTQLPLPLCEQLGDELEAIVHKCLRSDPSKRYQSAGDLARDIWRFLTGQPIEAGNDSGWYMLRKALRQEKVPVAAAAALLFDAIVNDYYSYRATSTPLRLAGATRIVLYSSVLIAALAALALGATIWASADFVDGIEVCFEVLFAATYVFAVPAAVGVILLTPAQRRPQRHGFLRNPRRMLKLAGVVALLLAALAALWMLVGDVLSNVFSVLWAVVPAAALLRGIEQMMNRVPIVKLARLARIELNGVILFGIASLTIFLMRQRIGGDSGYDAAWYALVLIALLGGITLAIGGVALLFRTHRALLQRRC